MAHRVLIIDDDDHWRALLAAWLGEHGYEAIEAGTGHDGVLAVASAGPAVVLLDWQLPDQDGIKTLKQVKQLGTGAEVVMLTAFVSPKLAVESVKEGAFDYICKSADMEEILVVVRRAMEMVLPRRAALHLTAEQYRGLILGNSEQIQHVHYQIAEAAKTNVPVLITGETGTGKELVARAIASGSVRCDRPFITVDCTTLRRELIESELFGHERGAFTGAYQRKRGQFELAAEGTLFLDEIGELDLPLQAKLLRVLERKQFLRVGGERQVTVDVRVMAATNRNLVDEIRAGQFRRDLFYRLNVVGIHLPPLRARAQDIPLLAEHFLSHFAREIRKPIRGIREDALDCLLRYQWPGNVRELENTIQRMVIFERSPYLGVDVLPQEIKHDPSCLPRVGMGAGEPVPPPAAGVLPLEEATQLFRRQYVEEALRSHGHRVDAAARALKVNRTHLYKLLKQLGLSWEPRA